MIYWKQNDSSTSGSCGIDKKIGPQKSSLLQPLKMNLGPRQSLKYQAQPYLGHAHMGGPGLTNQC